MAIYYPALGYHLFIGFIGGVLNFEDTLQLLISSFWRFYYCNRLACTTDIFVYCHFKTVILAVLRMAYKTSPFIMDKYFIHADETLHTISLFCEVVKLVKLINLMAAEFSAAKISSRLFCFCFVSVSFLCLRKDLHRLK